MSNLDTTLREKFAQWYEDSTFPPNADDTLTFLLAEFHQLLNEKREAIEQIEPYSIKLPNYGGLIGRTHHLISKDDVLSILND